MTRIDLLESEIKKHLNLGLTVIPLRCRSKKPLVRWGSGWRPTTEQLQSYFIRLANVGVLRGHRVNTMTKGLSPSRCQPLFGHKGSNVPFGRGGDTWSPSI